MMNIGIIGTGNMGSGLGRLWANKGPAVFFGSRDPHKARKMGESLGMMGSGGTITQAAAFGRIVLLAVRWDAVPDALRATKSLEGKILIDCTNPMTSTGCSLPKG